MKKVREEEATWSEAQKQEKAMEYLDVLLKLRDPTILEKIK
jgi:hypothetical protein